MGLAGEGIAPSGTVTFLFTDVEGSTRLWAADTDAMAASLRVHDNIVRTSVEARGGFVFTTAGDSFAVAFAKPSAAVEAAVAAQESLASATWPGPPLRVRMGLHVGEADERGGDYFGPVVNACARVEAAGHGGQVLVTDAVRSVINRSDFVDLGAQRLRDLPEPMALFQVGHGDFPPLRGVVGSRDSLPTRRTRLVGRDGELGTIGPVLASERLVTLVGPGGIGKTSLAVEAAGRVSAQFPGGAHFADLAPVSDPADIVGALCRGVQLAVTNAPYEQLCRFLSTARTLLLVDNCEHLIDEVAETVDRLLGDVASLHVLATSREFLNVDGERVVRVDPLPSGVGSAAVRLFVERVVAVSPAFDPGTGDLEQISSICARLDGLPLAIELAAGRARSMSLAEIERGLGDRFALLAGGPRGKLRRQQTLRAAIDWSIELLDPAERSLLARLAVFAGPFSVDGAAAVAAPLATGAADGMASLSAKSLVDRVADVDGDARFRLLETVREWGLDELARADLLRDVRDQHAQWYLTMAERLDAPEWTWQVGSSVATVDAVSAALHLRERDIIGAALIIAVRSAGLVETGFAAVGRDIQRDVRAAGWTRSPCRLWIAEHAHTQGMLEGFPYDDPPPPDDGSFEWRYLVGGAAFDNSGFSGWYRTWLEPAAVVAEARSLPPVAADDESHLIRAFGLANAVLALVHLGYFDEAIAAFEASRRLTTAYGRPAAGTSVEIYSLAIAALCLGVDLRGTVGAAEIHDRQGGLISLGHHARSLITSAPNDRRVAMATAAREHCHGRCPGEESAYLACFAHFALEDGDPDRARYLNESLILRSPATLSIMRHTSLRANFEPLDLIADQRHHQKMLFAQAARPPVESLEAEHRRKLHAEIARILD